MFIYNHLSLLIVFYTPSIIYNSRMCFFIFLKLFRIIGIKIKERTAAEAPIPVKKPLKKLTIADSGR